MAPYGKRKNTTTQNGRALDDVYPVIYIDAIHYPVRDNDVIVKKSAYVILGLTCDGHTEVLSVAIAENERAKFRLNALNELKNRGVQDAMIICADGLTGSTEPMPSQKLIISVVWLMCFATR